ncbi:MAG: PIG-L family deacetylase [Nanoarchaeota archaeon]
MKKENILCFVAHPDDSIIGIGSTLAKYVKEKKRIIEVIFSYGEISHLKKEIIVKKRVSEIKSAAKILGYKDIIFFGLPDSKIKQNVEKVKDDIKKLIRKYRPIKIFTHSPSDKLPDHLAVNEAVISCINEMKFDTYIYGFDVWNITNLKESENPKLYVDVSDTFELKIKALKEFKSQRHVILQLMPSIYTRAKLHGDHLDCKYAERFYKLN